MPRTVVFLLALILPLQVLSATWRHLTHAPDRMLEHMVEHARHVPHHHDEDGTIHKNGGGESVAHQLDFDHGTSVGAALPDVLEPAASKHGQPEPFFLASALPDPCLHLLHPPPRPVR
ncbi:hypothetical protein [Cupriavidus consociatus]|uniref:hypothetical protein n=1 Tax=Cupriavidus consociatus TaxID=2821357 RepID=UPI001AE1B785|nr:MULTISPECIES: hypothetical protein [unclassified Cupriavidus]MBP0621210.1 hypothetical protein [Cupriavidus sp. LEh25]MDK2657881.1 hypothetical protein [Cupriavidus sp. LEh21]